jgi:UDP-N-acetylglucosamine 2-epimerase (non-hydrolysing)
MTIFGTRPEIIRLSLIIKGLDNFCDHILVHTGQNYDKNLSDIFFDELNIRQPDIYLGIRTTDFSEQIGQIIRKTGEILKKISPDRILILGDTNSGLAAIVAARMGIPVYHLEAGNRCFDDRVPEEINRRVIDHSSTILMPYPTSW